MKFLNYVRGWARDIVSSLFTPEFFIAVALIAMMLMAVSAHGQAEDTNDSLEVRLVVPTPDGPQLTYDSGCYVYGLFYSAVVHERAQGVPLTFQLERLEENSKSQAAVPGMYDFLLQQTIVIYNLPEGFLQIEPYRVKLRAIDVCRKANGMTWLISERT